MGAGLTALELHVITTNIPPQKQSGENYPLVGKLQLDKYPRKLSFWSLNKDQVDIHVPNQCRLMRSERGNLLNTNIYMLVIISIDCPMCK